jgi:hypothetical protein
LLEDGNKAGDETMEVSRASKVVAVASWRRIEARVR